MSTDGRWRLVDWLLIALAAGGFVVAVSMLPGRLGGLGFIVGGVAIVGHGLIVSKDVGGVGSEFERLAPRIWRLRALSRIHGPAWRAWIGEGAMLVGAIWVGLGLLLVVGPSTGT